MERRTFPPRLFLRKYGGNIKMKRKLLSVLLCFCMALTLVPAALAAGPEDGPEAQEFPEWDVMPMDLDMAVPFSLNAEAAPAPLADEAAAPTDPIADALGNVTVSGGVYTLNSDVDKGADHQRHGGDRP